MEKKAIIFDLDGTLVNTIEDLADCVNHVLKKHGYPTHEISKFKAFIGSGAKNMVAAALPEMIRKQNELLEPVLEEYKSYYALHYKDKSKPYQGIQEMLEAFSEKNIPLAVCSNKQQSATGIMIREMFPEDTFCCIYGERKGVQRKPDPAGPLEIAEKMQIQPENIIFAGDSDADILTAVNAGMIPVGVAWGFREVSELLENGAVFIAYEPRDLVDFFFS